MKTKKFLSIAILIILVATFAWYLINHLSDFKQLSFVNPIYLVVLVVLFLFNYILISIVTKNLLSPLNVKLKKMEAFALSIVTGFYNLITPFRGGMVTRAVYLKKKHNFSYTNFLATLTATYVLTFLIASFLGLISTLLIYKNTGTFSSIIFFIFLAVFIPLTLTVIFSPKIRETKRKWINRFIRVINGWHLIKNNGRLILITSFVSLIQLIVGSYMIYLQFRIFGIEVSFVAALFLASIGSISMLLQITPANLGVNEAIMVFSAATIGITPVQSLSVSLIGRGVQMLVLFILGPIFSYILLKNNPQKNETKN